MQAQVNGSTMSFVTYSNEAKMRILGVEEKALQKVGAVSAMVAKQWLLALEIMLILMLLISITNCWTNCRWHKESWYRFHRVAIGEKTFANSTELGGNRAENKAGFVHFAIQTALDCWARLEI